MLPKKRVRSNQVQLKMFVDYMSTHKNFANGEFSGPMGNKQHLQQWEELRVLLRNYGPDKTVEQWRHTWRDLKKKAREDGARVKKATNSTGNHIPVPSLSELSDKILGVIGSEMAFGIENSEESGIGGFLVQQPLSAHRIGSSMEHLSRSIQARAQDKQVQVLPLLPSSLPSPPTTQQLPQIEPEEFNRVVDRSLLSGAQVPQEVQVVPPPLPRSLQTVPAPLSHSAPSIPPPTTTPQQRRIGLGDRAAEFLAAEKDTTNVLKDIFNTLAAQNLILQERNTILFRQDRMKNRERLRQARQEVIMRRWL